MFEVEIEFFTRFSLTVEFVYYPATPDTRWEPGTPDEVEIDKVFYQGKELPEKDIDDHLLEAIESWIIDHFDDWYDDPYA